MLTSHKIMIEQNVDGENHWTTLQLRDTSESRTVDADSKFTATGTWKHTDDSYNDKEITFTSDNPKYLYWEWRGGPRGGDISIGSKMGRASHKEGEDEYFQVLITLYRAQRLVGGHFKVAGVLDDGTGKLTYNVSAPGGGYYFTKGDITWTLVVYAH